MGLDIIKYIEELLYANNCVVLPGFGGFVANYKSATINQFQNKFTPPSKSISFNRQLTKNDGLLLSHIVTTTNCTYAEAEKQIQVFVADLHKELKQNGAVELEKIGRVFTNDQGSLLFEPSLDNNFLLDAFGLYSFNLQPIVTSEKEEELIVAKEVQLKPEVAGEVKSSTDKQQKEPKEEPKVVPIQQNETKSNKSIWKRVAVAAVFIPIIAYIIWLPTKTEIFKGNGFTYADLNPFTTKICATYKLIDHGNIELMRLETDSLRRIFNTIDKDVVTFSLFEPTHPKYNVEKSIAVLLKPRLQVPVSTHVVLPEKNIYRYHIIGGCFQVYKNAERMVNKLRKNGYNSAIVDKHKGLYRVSFQSFVSRNEAKQMLAQVKQENKNAWLLIK